MSGEGNARLAILISGRGSNMQSLLRACESGQLDATVAVVLSNSPAAAGLDIAARAGVATRCIDHRDYPDRESFDRALVAALRPFTPDLVLLAGFMRILTREFVDAFPGRILNIHPSLLPKYPGLHTHQRALEAGDREAGVTVHFVTAELDGGPPIIRARVPVEPGDTADSLAARVLVKEHEIYPIAARWALQGRLQLHRGAVFLDGRPIPGTGIDHVRGIT